MIMVLNKSLKKTISLSMAFLLLWVLVGCNAQKAIVLSGTVESEQVDIYAEKPGKVVKLLKEEGQPVDKGEAVLMTDSETQALVLKQQQAMVDMKRARYDEIRQGSRSEQIKQAQAAADAAKARLDELQSGSRPELITQAEAAVTSAYAAMDIAQANYDLAKEQYDNAKSLFKSGAVSQNGLDEAKNKEASANGQLQMAQSQIDQAWANYDLLKSGSTTQSIEVAQANYKQASAQLELLKNGNTQQAIQQAKSDLDQSLAQLEQVKLALDKYLVKSPFKGTFIQSNVKEGELINTGTNIGTVSDLNDLWANFYITQADLGSIKLNQEVSMTSKSAQGQDIKGRIVFISAQAEFTPKNIETNAAKENTVFRFKVKITTNIAQLRPGMTISVRMPYGGAK